MSRTMCLTVNFTVLLVTANVHGDESRSDAMHLVDAHRSTVTQVSLSEDGSFLFSCSRDKTVAKWDRESLDEVWRYEADSSVSRISVSSNGTLVACMKSNGNLEVLDGERGQVDSTFQLPWHRNARAVELQFQGMAKVLVADCMGAVDRIDLRGHEVEALVAPSVIGEPLLLSVGTQGSDGLLFLGFQDNSLWVLHDGALVGEYVIGREEPVISGGGVNDIAVSGDARQVIAGNNHGEVVVLDIVEGGVKEAVRWRVEGSVYAVAFFENSNRAAVLFGNRVEAWSLEPLRRLAAVTVPNDRFSSLTSGIVAGTIGVGTHGGRVGTIWLLEE